MHELDSVVLQKVASGDDEAAGVFVGRFGAVIAASVRRMGVAAADVPDLCQEILSCAIHEIRRGRFAGRSAVTTWLFQIARHKTVDHWRRQARQSRLVSRAAREQPSMSWTAQELDLLVEEILRNMPHVQASAFRKRFIQGDSLESIAESVNLSTSRVLAILARAKREVRTAIQDKPVCKALIPDPAGK